MQNTFGSSCEKLAQVAQPLSNGSPKSENEAVANTLPKGSGNFDAQRAMRMRIMHQLCQSYFNFFLQMPH